MKIKVNETTPLQLDWLVATAEGSLVPVGNVKLIGKQLFIGVGNDYAYGDGYNQVLYSPSTDWAQGGPIVEREKISIVTDDQNADVWIGSMFEPDWKFNRTGPTPLIAAMRCYVASKLGDEVEVPDELSE